MAWDNSCYRKGTSFDSLLGMKDTESNNGIDYCATHHDAEVFVPNSKDEAEFVGKYLKEIGVGSS